MSRPPDLGTWQAWKDIHQRFELDWWAERLPDHCADPGFTEQWREVIDFIKPAGAVLDIGCGPRPPFSPCSVIEPLANEYKKLVPQEWWAGVTAYDYKAEMVLPALRGRFDTVICWNALDHAVGWRDILDNMLAYAKPGARFAVAADFYEPFIGHPGFDPDSRKRDRPSADMSKAARLTFDREIAKRFKIVEFREPFGRALALLMVAK